MRYYMLKENKRKLKGPANAGLFYFCSMVHFNWTIYNDMQEAFHGSLRLLKIERQGKTFYEVQRGKYKRSTTNYVMFMKDIERMA